MLPATMKAVTMKVVKAKTAKGRRHRKLIKGAPSGAPFFFGAHSRRGAIGLA